MTIMPFERETTALVTGTSGATVTGYGSTFMTGFVDSVYVKIDSEASTGVIVKITSSSTSNVIFTVVDPSTLGVTYRPRGTAYTGGTTALTAVNPTSAPIPISVYRERMRVSVVSTTATAHIASVRMRINPLY